MKNRNKYLLISGVIILVLIGVLIYFKFFHEPRSQICKIVRVLDGDTFLINVRGNDQCIRLLYVNTSESEQPEMMTHTEWGRKIHNKVRILLPQGTEVLLEKEEGTDNWNNCRLLRYMFIPGKITGGETEFVNFNVWLVKEGWSPYFVKYGHSKKYDKEFLEAEKYAREHKKIDEETQKMFHEVLEKKGYIIPPILKGKKTDQGINDES